MPLLATAGFFVLGIGSYAWISFGFLGTYSVDLRWAFTTRIALLLFAVPFFVLTGRPIALARAALSGLPLRILERILVSWPIRLVGNAIFATLLALAAFMVFLTPFAFVLRDTPGWEWAITVLVPIVGVLMILPIADSTLAKSSLFITAEFLLVFVELVLDALPGILLRLNGAVLDGASTMAAGLPAWFPNPLRDQQLSGDLLWFIAEIADIPVLILLFARWLRSDRHEARNFDELTDEQMDELTRAHLRRNSDGS